MSLQYKLNNPEETGYRTAYGPKIKHSYDLVITEENEGTESLTNQSYAPQCDVNQVLKRFQKTGVQDHVSQHEGQYGDISEFDYQTSLNTVAQAQSEFQELPASIRKQFGTIENYLAYMVQDHEDPEKAILEYGKQGENSDSASGDSSTDTPEGDSHKQTELDTSS